MTEDRRTRSLQEMEKINAKLHLLDGATLEWWGFSVSHGHSVWKLTGLPQGVGYVFTANTRYIHFPLVMRDVHISAATSEETADLRGQLSLLEARNVEEQNYHIIECKEGKFSVLAWNFAVSWGERDVSPMLWGG